MGQAPPVQTLHRLADGYRQLWSECIESLLHLPGIDRMAMGKPGPRTGVCGGHEKYPAIDRIPDLPHALCGPWALGDNADVRSFEFVGDGRGVQRLTG